MSTTIKNSDMSLYLKKAYLEKEDRFDFIGIAQRIEKEIATAMMEKEEVKKKIQALSVLKNDKFLSKEKELVDILDQNRRKIEKLKHLADIEVSDVEDFVQKKNQQVDLMYKTRKDGIHAKYHDAIKSFKDDEGFIEELYSEKEKDMNKAIEAINKKPLFQEIDKIKPKLQDALQKYYAHIAQSQEQREGNAIDIGGVYDKYYTMFNNCFLPTSKELKQLGEIVHKIGMKKQNMSIADIMEKNTKYAGTITFLMRKFGILFTSNIKDISEQKDILDAVKKGLEIRGATSEVAEKIIKALISGNMTSDPEQYMQDIIGEVADDVYSESDMKKMDMSTEIGRENMRKHLRGIKLHKERLTGLYQISKSMSKINKTLSSEGQRKIEELYKKMSKGFQALEDAMSVAGSNYEFRNAYIEDNIDDLEGVVEDMMHISDTYMTQDKNNAVAPQLMIILISMCGGLAKDYNVNRWLYYVDIILKLYREEHAHQGGDDYESMFAFLTGYKQYITDIEEGYIDSENLLAGFGEEILQDPSKKESYVQMFSMVVKSMEGWFNGMNSYKKIQKIANRVLSSQSVSESIESDADVMWEATQESLFKIPYDDPIILDGEYVKEPEKYVMEVHRIESPHYFGMVKINSFKGQLDLEDMIRMMSDYNEKPLHDIKSQFYDARTKSTNDIIGVTNMVKGTGSCCVIDNTGHLSIDGLNASGLAYVLGDDQYDKLRYVVLSHIATCCDVIDMGGKQDDDTSAMQGYTEEQDIKMRDMRKVYDDSDGQGLSRDIPYRSDHIRLLNKKMITGPRGRALAKESKMPLYANIYREPYDPKTTRPVKFMRIDDVDTYDECKERMKSIRDTHNTETTTVQFQTYISECKSPAISYTEVPKTLIKIDQGM